MNANGMEEERVSSVGKSGGRTGMRDDRLSGRSNEIVYSGRSGMNSSKSAKKSGMEDTGGRDWKEGIGGNYMMNEGVENNLERNSREKIMNEDEEERLIRSVMRNRRERMMRRELSERGYQRSDFDSRRWMEDEDILDDD